MASNETEAYRIMRMLDVDYALVIFGGMSGYRWVGRGVGATTPLPCLGA